MLESRPRRIDGNITSVFHLFVDAAHEPTWPGLGGVLINERGNPMGYFSEEITGPTLDEFKAKSENPIFEMECFAIYCGVILWSRLIQGCNVVVYTDNQGTLSCMIKGHSENQLGNVIVNAAHRTSDECSLQPLVRESQYRIQHRRRSLPWGDRQQSRTPPVPEPL